MAGRSSCGGAGYFGTLGPRSGDGASRGQYQWRGASDIPPPSWPEQFQRWLGATRYSGASDCDTRQDSSPPSKEHVLYRMGRDTRPTRRGESNPIPPSRSRSENGDRQEPRENREDQPRPYRKPPADNSTTAVGQSLDAPVSVRTPRRRGRASSRLRHGSSIAPNMAWIATSTLEYRKPRETPCDSCGDKSSTGVACLQTISRMCR